ncbi:MAG: type II toxin-antitoxin system VapB family antitoxin [Deltaproteobacteria bacterium]|nr:type II toxin-antitoxin system VapB family antitoxin [Deltaproteobacteria bacterium]
MRTTVDLDEELLNNARSCTQIQSKTALLHAGLKALIAHAARERLAKLGGIEKNLRLPRRRRVKP